MMQRQFINLHTVLILVSFIGNVKLQLSTEVVSCTRSSITISYADYKNISDQLLHAEMAGEGERLHYPDGPDHSAIITGYIDTSYTNSTTLTIFIDVPHIYYHGWRKRSFDRFNLTILVYTCVTGSACWVNMSTGYKNYPNIRLPRYPVDPPAIIRFGNIGREMLYRLTWMTRGSLVSCNLYLYDELLHQYNYTGHELNETELVQWQSHSFTIPVTGRQSYIGNTTISALFSRDSRPLHMQCMDSCYSTKNVSMRPTLEPPRLLVWLMKRIVFGVVLRVQEQARLRYEQRIKYVVIYRKLGLTDQWIKIVDQEVWKTQKPLKDGPWTGRVFNVTIQPLDAGQTYYLKIVGIDYYGFRTQETLAQFATMPPPPMDLAVDTTKDDTLHVGWSSPSFSSETDYDSSYIPYAWCRVMKDPVEDCSKLASKITYNSHSSRYNYNLTHTHHGQTLEIGARFRRYWSSSEGSFMNIRTRPLPVKDLSWTPINSTHYKVIWIIPQTHFTSVEVSRNGLNPVIIPANQNSCYLPWPEISELPDNKQIHNVKVHTVSGETKSRERQIFVPLV